MTGVTTLGEATNRIVKAVTQVLAVVAASALSLIVLLTVVDVLSRFVLNKPIKGTVELTQIMTILLTFLVMAYVTRKQRHICLDLLVSRLPLQKRAILESFTLLLSLFFFSVFAWRSVGFTLRVWQTKEHSALLGIPTGLIWVFVTIGLFWLCLELVIRLVDSTGSIVKGSRETAQK